MHYLYLALILFIYMNLWFVFSVVKRRNDYADVAWGLGFVLMVWSSYLFGLKGAEDFYIQGLIACLLVTLWGLRLSLHIFKRNKNKQEDYRYKAWRDSWGSLFYPRSYLQIYMLQGAFLYLISLSFIYINLNPLNNGLLITDFLGLAIWIIGFYFESTSDAQLSKFIANPENKGRVMKSGLWRYSRHPNYFGEVTMWWGLYALSLSTGFWPIILVSPLTISFLILFVSGVPLLEKKYQGNPEFEEYKRVTSVFFPRPPKKM